MAIMNDVRAEYLAQAVGDEPEQTQSVAWRDPVKELGWARIEHILTLDINLSDGAYRTYALLHFYWQRKNAAWVGTDTMATVRGCKESTISNHLKELIDAGLISRSRRMGRTSMTYLEDLPERYAEAAGSILAKRQKNVGKLSKKLDVTDPIKSTYRMRTIEEEPLKENGANPAPILPSMEEKALKDAALLKEFEAMPSAAAGLAPQARTAATADPRIAEREFINAIAPRLATILGRGMISQDKQAARQIYGLHLQIEWLDARLNVYQNGGGKEFQKSNATAFWIKTALENDRARGVHGKKVRLEITQ